MPKKRKTTFKHRIEYGLYRIFEFIFSSLSLSTVHSLGHLFGRIVYFIAPPIRRVVTRNLRVAFYGEKTEQEIQALVPEILEQSAANFATSIHTSRIPENELSELVEFKNLSLCHDLIAQGKGVILLVPHMGNWELLAQLASTAKVSVPCGTHYRPLNNPILDRLIQCRRTQRGLKLFAKASSIHAMASFLREGSLLAILADQRMAKNSNLSPFFQRLTHCSPLPSALAERTEATLLALSCRTLDAGRWEISFIPVNGTSPDHCALAMENAWRDSVKDVFWLHDRWKLNHLNAKKIPNLDNFPNPVRILSLSHDPSIQAPSLGESPRPDLQIESLVIDPDSPPSKLVEIIQNQDALHPLPIQAIVPTKELQALVQPLSSQLGIPVHATSHV